MDIQDYTNRLSKARDNYHEKSKELRENYDRDVAHMEETHKAKQDKAEKAYRTQALENEESVKNLSEQQVKNSQEEVSRLKRNFRNEMDDTRRGFELASAKERAELNTKLRDVRDAYYDSARTMNRNHQNQLNRTEERLTDQLKSKSVQFAEDVESLQNRSREDYNLYRDQVAQEKKDLISSKNKQITDQMEGFSRETADAKFKHDNALVEARRTFNEEKNQLKDHSNQMLANQKEINSNNSSDINENYQRMMADMERRNDTDQKRLLREHHRNVKEIDKANQKDKNMLKRKMDAIANNGLRGDSAFATLERTKSAYEDRLKRQKIQNEDARVTHAIEKERMMNISQKHMHDQKRRFQDLRDEDAKNNAKYTNEVLDRNRREREKVVNQYQRDLKQSKLKGENDLIANRAENRRKSENQKIDFARRINSMTEKNLETIAELQKDTAREKSKFIENSKREIHNKSEELKDSLNASYKKKSDSYESKIAILEQEKKAQAAGYESALANLKKKTNEELAIRSQLEQERKMELDRTFKRTLAGKEMENARVIQTIRQQFDKKLSDEKHRNDLQLNKMTQRYESQIKRTHRENNAKMKRKLGHAREHYERLAQASSNERQALIDKYELKIQKLKDAVERARETKRVDQRREAEDIS